MAAPLGNEFWKMRSSHGRAPQFATAETLWEAALEYFDWAHANPLEEEKLFAYQGDITRERVAKMRAMTIGGLCIFLDISRQAWSEYERREGYGEVTHRISEVIRSQKFEGAAADMLNPNIIARDLGLVDKQHVETPIELSLKPDIDLARTIAFLLQRDAKAKP